MSYMYVIHTFFYCLASVSLGLLLIKVLSRDDFPDKDYSFYAVTASGFLLGQGVLGHVWLLLGLYSLFKASLIWSILIIITIAGSGILRGIFHSLVLRCKGLLLQLGNLPIVWQILLFLTIVLILLFGLKSFVFPPRGDPESFYMVLSKIMASAEKFVPLPYGHVLNHIGFMGEMHFAALMSIADVPAAKFYVWFTALALAIIILAICKETGVRLKGQIIALLMLFSSTVFTNFIYDGKVDIFAAAYGVTAYYWAMRTTRKSPVFVYILTGLFSGLSIVAKFSYIPIILAGVGIFLIWNLLFFDESLRGRVKEGMITIGYGFIVIGISVIIAVIPHIIKNQVLFEEPFAPLVYLKSDDPHWTKADFFPYSSHTKTFIRLTYPIAITHGKYPSQSGNVSFFILSFIPLAIFLKKKNSLLKSRLFQVTTVAALCLVIFMISGPTYFLVPRYYMATLLLFIPLSALSAENLLVTDIGWRVLKFFVYFSMCFYLFIFIIGESYQPVRFLYRTITGVARPCELASVYCKPLSFINEKASSGDRIFIGASYPYFLRADLLQCVSSYVEQMCFISLKTSERKWEYLYNRGFKYLLIQDTHESWFEEFNRDSCPSWMKVNQIFADKSTEIYEISPIETIMDPSCKCRQIHPPAWNVINGGNP